MCIGTMSLSTKYIWQKMNYKTHTYLLSIVYANNFLWFCFFVEKVIQLIKFWVKFSSLHYIGGWDKIPSFLKHSSIPQVWIFAAIEKSFRRGWKPVDIWCNEGSFLSKINFVVTRTLHLRTRHYRQSWILESWWILNRVGTDREMGSPGFLHI